VVFFRRGAQIRGRHRYGGAKIRAFWQIHNSIITLSAPEGGQTPLATSMEGHGRICPLPGSTTGQGCFVQPIVAVLAQHANKGNVDKGKTLHAEQAPSYSKDVLTKIGQGIALDSYTHM